MTDEQPTSLTGLLATIEHQVDSPPAPPQPSSSTNTTQQDPNIQILALIERADRLASSLSLFSDNDTLDDLPTATLRALFIHSAWAEVEGRVNTMGDFQKRRSRLVASRAHYVTFLRTLFDLGILPKKDAADGLPGTPNFNASPTQVISALVAPLVGGASSSTSTPASEASLPSNPSQRRELKVALFKLERAFKTALDGYRLAAREKAALRSGGGLSVPGLGTSTGASDPSSQPDEAQWDWLILSKRQRGGRTNADDDDDGDGNSEEEEDDDVFVSGSGSTSASTSTASAITPPTTLRNYLVLLLQFHALMAYNNLASMDDELKLLANIPASADRDARERQAREEAEAERHRRGGVDGSDEFRLDRRFDASAPGPLMDDKGKPLRPFTITSGGGGSSSSRNPSLPIHDLDERQRIRQGVFQPSHRLPTMSIDEYLAEEERRGNILRGGGAEGAAQATPREARALRAEQDGTREAEEADDEARREAIEWDTFKESNKRGAGNTMNRG